MVKFAEGRLDLRPMASKLKKKNCFNVYSFLRDRVQAGVGQRERETQNPKQAPGSNSRAEDHDLSRSQMLHRLSQPGIPIHPVASNHSVGMTFVGFVVLQNRMPPSSFFF